MSLVSGAAQVRQLALTRSAEDNQPLRRLLSEAAAAEPHFAVAEWPTAAFVDIGVEPDRQAVEHWLGLARAVTFTSRHGALSWLRQMGAASLARPGLQVAAVGEGTAEVLRAAELKVAIIANEPSTGAHLAQLVADQLLPNKTVLVVQGRLARRDLAEGLARRSLDVRIATVYANREPAIPAVDLDWLGPQTLVYAAAPSAVARILQWFPKAQHCQWAAIGPTTAQALADHGLQPQIVCHSPDLAVVAETLRRALTLPSAPPPAA